MSMKLPTLRHTLAGATVAAATLLGTQAKASPIYVTAALTSTNVTTEVDDRITYQPGTKATMHFTLDTDTAASGISAGNSGYAEISTPTGPVTIVDSNVRFTNSNSAYEAIVIVGGDNLWLESNTVSTPGLGIGAGPAIYEQYSSNFNTYGPKQPAATYAFTSPNSPEFLVDSLTITVPEPASLALGAAGTGMLLLGRRRPSLSEVRL